MVKKVDTATVHLWGDTVGAVSWLEDRGHAVFEYNPAFLKQGLDISPLRGLCGPSIACRLHYAWTPTVSPRARQDSPGPAAVRHSTIGGMTDIH